MKTIYVIITHYINNGIVDDEQSVKTHPTCFTSYEKAEMTLRELFENELLNVIAEDFEKYELGDNLWVDAEGETLFSMWIEELTLNE